MNESGTAVASISSYYQIPPEHVVVIHDDMDLEFGRIKVKAGGSAGGHNGIKSIDRSLGTNAYARVRLGVGHARRGPNAHDNTVNWVLGGFGPDQRKQLPEFLADGADAAETIIFSGLSRAQEQFNGR
jgi:PTH1 family peptidyl-tRNA hydrolase